MQHARRSIVAVAMLAVACTACASESDPAYFIIDGNPVAAKYVSGRLVRLPIQDADDVDSLGALEAVSALLRAPRLTSLSTTPPSAAANISQPRKPEYGAAMFEVAIGGSAMPRVQPFNLIWSGPTPFHEILLDLPGANGRLKRSLVADARRALAPGLDFRQDAAVGRKLEIDGPVSVRDYGRTAAAPDLAFIDITWRIRNLPKALQDRGIDSISPFLRVDYVINTRTGRIVFRDTTDEGGIVPNIPALLPWPMTGSGSALSVTAACA